MSSLWSLLCCCVLLVQGVADSSNHRSNVLLIVHTKYFVCASAPPTHLLIAGLPPF